MIKHILIAAALLSISGAAHAASAPSAMLGLMAKASAAANVSAPPAAPAPANIACADLPASLAKAKGGETFKLPAGVCDVTTTLVANPATPVTVTSQDVNNPATLVYTPAGGSWMANSSKINFSYVNFSSVGNPDPLYAFRMYTNQYIGFDHFDAHGDPTIAPGLQSSLFYIKPGSHISFTNGKCHDTNACITAGDADGASDFLTVTGNDFYRLSKGGLETGGVSDVTFTNNTCRDFIIYTLVHSDCFQLFTAGTTAQPHDIVATDNTLLRGVGDGFQGIFLGDEAGLYLKNVTVSRNIVKGGMWDSIWIDSPVGNLVVTDNYAISWIGNSPEGGAGVVTDYRADLMITKAPNGVLTSAIITNNSAQAYGGTYFPTYAPPAGNFILGAVSPLPAN